MPAAARLGLFHEVRIATAVMGLAVFPLLAFASAEPVAVTLALLLAALLPCVITLETRRPAALDRAVVLHIVALSTVLVGGVLRGLPAAAALMLILLAAIEAHLVARRAGRALAAAAAGAGAIALAAGGHPAPTGAGHAGAIAVALLALAAGLTMLRALINSLSDRIKESRSDRVLHGEVDSVVSETVLAIDRTGGVARASANAPRILGLPTSALLGRGLVSLTLVSDRPALLTAIAEAAQVSARQTLRMRLRSSADDTRPSYRWAEIIIEPAGESRLALAALRDVSADVLEEERLRQASEEAETAKAARSAFLATVNHELRTPLNAIIGFSEFIANPMTTPGEAERVREYARLINIAGHDLHRMVSAMIDMTRIDQGVYAFEPENADLGALTAATVEAFGREPEARGASFSLKLPARPLHAQIDARAFRAVLQEILSNAAKFGGGSPVEVVVSAGAEGPAVAVRDQGVGISGEQIALIGRSFARLDQGLDRERGGIGIGLSLARGLMALHGGRIGIGSRQGEGTTVTLQLPLSEPAAAPVNVLNIAERRTATHLVQPRKRERKRA
jgi:two-component system, cell cycle sensor histidine kinase DivJ